MKLRLRVWLAGLALCLFPTFAQAQHFLNQCSHAPIPICADMTPTDAAKVAAANALAGIEYCVPEGYALDSHDDFAAKDANSENPENLAAAIEQLASEEPLDVNEATAQPQPSVEVVTEVAAAPVVEEIAEVVEAAEPAVEEIAEVFEVAEPVMEEIAEVEVVKAAAPAVEEVAEVAEPAMEEIAEVFEAPAPAVEEIAEVMEAVEPAIEEIAEVEVVEAAEPTIEEIAEVEVAEAAEPAIEEIAEVEVVEVAAPAAEEIAEVMEAAEPAIEEIAEVAEIAEPAVEVTEAQLARLMDAPIICTLRDPEEYLPYDLTATDALQWQIFADGIPRPSRSVQIPLRLDAESPTAPAEEVAVSVEIPGDLDAIDCGEVEPYASAIWNDSPAAEQVAVAEPVAEEAVAVEAVAGSSMECLLDELVWQTSDALRPDGWLRSSVQPEAIGERLLSATQFAGRQADSLLNQLAQQMLVQPALVGPPAPAAAPAAAPFDAPEDFVVLDQRDTPQVCCPLEDFSNELEFADAGHDDLESIDENLQAVLDFVRSIASPFQPRIANGGQETDTLAR